MKNVKLLLGLIAIVSLGMFMGCEDTAEGDLSPDISLKAGADYYVSGTTVAPGSLIKFGVTVTANAESGKKIQNVRVTRTFNNSPTVVVDTSLNEDTFVQDWILTARNEAGEENIKIEAFDKDNESAEISFNIVTDAGLTKSLISHDITLGAQNSATGSFCASFEGEVYTITELKDGNEYANVDIVYYYGATNKSALFSPKSIADNSITWSGSVPTENWGTPNETLFNKVSAADYNDATYTSVETLGMSGDLHIANGGRSPVDGLKSGDAYAFKTADGKYGVLSVTSVSGENDGTISFTVKIQED